MCLNNTMNLKTILLLSLFFIVGCGGEQPNAVDGPEATKKVAKKPSVVMNNPGIEGCSHSFMSVPDVYKSTPDKPAKVTFSYIKSAVNLDAVDKVVGIDKSAGRGILPVVTTVFTKNGAAVERVGLYSYFCKDGNCSGDDLGVSIEVADKEKFTDTFGAYPKVDCRVIGMSGSEPNGPVQEKYSPAIEGCSHKFDYLPDSLNPNSDGTFNDNAFSRIVFGINYTTLDNLIGLQKEEKKTQWIDAVATIYTKDGVAVERTGTVGIYYENGFHRPVYGIMGALSEKVGLSTTEFTETFGEHPKVDCKIVGV